MTGGFDEADIACTIRIYPGVRHWFAETDVAQSWNPEAAGLALDRPTAFLHDRLG